MQNTADAAVVWLHGRGEKGTDWTFFRYSTKEVLPRVEWTFPTAPEQWVTCDDSELMTAWFDIATIPVNPECERDDAGYASAIRRVHEVIQELEQEFSSERIIVGGFSQGAALALGSALQYPRPLAGIVVMSGWSFHRGEEFASRVHPSNAQVPVLICHGVCDDTVPLRCAMESRELLQGMGNDPLFREYPGLYHSSTQEEKQDVIDFVRNVLYPPSDV